MSNKYEQRFFSALKDTFVGHKIKVKTYAWCECGKSEKQPWCNGAHKGSEFSPIVFQAKEAKAAAMCMCKQTNNPPYCDGSHMKL